MYIFLLIKTNPHVLISKEKNLSMDKKMQDVFPSLSVFYFGLFMFYFAPVHVLMPGFLE